MTTRASGILSSVLRPQGTTLPSWAPHYPAGYPMTSYVSHFGTSYLSLATRLDLSSSRGKYGSPDMVYVNSLAKPPESN